jgi:hypothetical protein
MAPGTVGGDFYEGITTDGTGSGPTPYTWGVVAGRLPGGLSLTANGPYAALVSGTPTTVGTSTFTVQVRDGEGRRSPGWKEAPSSFSAWRSTMPWPPMR